MFDKSTIYLIDDGSTDVETIQIVNELSKNYDNVVSYFYETGGSGSASRPRNKGIELSTEQYVTFLDPDDETTGDGYKCLLEKVKEYNVDFAVGPNLLVTEKNVKKTMQFVVGLTENPQERLIERNFAPFDIQSAIINRSLIDKNEMSFVEGAFGEDSLFSQLLLIHAKNVYGTKKPVRVYYSERVDSAVNAVNRSFFDKCYICEKARVRIFANAGLLEQYKSLRLSSYLKCWHLEKLKHVKNCDYEYCSDVIKKIILLYQ